MYEIVFHSRVIDDLKQIAPAIQKTVRKAIEGKLTTSPEVFGKPLQFSLKGVRSMRVGDYRVMFQMEKQVVKVILIGHRSSVYKEAKKRSL